MNNSVRVGILGAGGFTGQELIRIFAHHAAVELVYLTSSEYADKKLSAAFPALAAPAFADLKFSPHPKTVTDAPQLDVVFLATPDEVALAWAPQFLAAGVRVRFDGLIPYDDDEREPKSMPRPLGKPTAAVER